MRSVAIGGGATLTYTLDVDGQRVRSWTDGTTTRTHHYDGDGDSPSWTQESASAWTRNIGGISGDMAAVYSSASSSAVLQLANLLGDVVATAATSSTALASTMEATEYGVPRGATGTRYAWLGAKQRAADTPGGLSIMGVRLYNPQTGKFLQNDPVYGGNANAYTYPNDPLTQYDLDGRRCRWCLPSPWEMLRGGGRAIGRSARWAYRHTEISIGGCMGWCWGLGFQGGTGYLQTGVGCCFAGGNIGLARKEYKNRRCSYYTGTGAYGPFGAYGDVGAKRRARMDRSDVSGGYSYGAGFGGGYIRNFDLGGQKRYCR